MGWQREGREAPMWKVGGSGTGKKLGTKHDISLAESGHFLPRLFRRVLRLRASRKKFRFSCAEEVMRARARTLSYSSFRSVLAAAASWVHLDPVEATRRNREKSNNSLMVPSRIV